MQAELRKIDNANIEECIALSVTEEQAQYIAPNQDSLKDANDNPAVARPFAIYVDNRMVGYIKLSTKESNSKAISLYRKFGFKENGEMNDEEIVLQLAL